nr:immunoglobulin heavy chain junction region [Mus musculus]
GLCGLFLCKRERWLL